MQYRIDYPRPQLKRDSFICLNGTWKFTIDYGETLPERGFFSDTNYNMEIIVPFCPESPLSGIACRDFMNSVAYQKKVKLPNLRGDRLILHFGACDYETEVYIDRNLVGRHIGGYSSFSFDITDFLSSDECTITVYARDHGRSGRQGRGKQSPKYFSNACDYTRTTGIWQTVWMEQVPPLFIKNIRLTPKLANSELFISGSVNKWSRGRLKVIVRLGNKTVAENETHFMGREFLTLIKIHNPEPWEPNHPVLYDLELVLDCNNGCIDTVQSYFGMRDVHLENNAFVLNGKKIFLRTVLDQGFYPDGVYTAPTDNALRNDILLAKKAGFNGARLHQKIFEERFLYHCDQLGYLVFEEYPDAGSDRNSEFIFLPIAAEWSECIERDYSHPSIIGWCPYNETSPARNPKLQRETYMLTRRLDPSRPVIDTSGYTHEITDVYDVHDYEQDPKVFRGHMAKAATVDCWRNFPEFEKYGGQPYFVSEFGGIFWSEEKGNGWGYGESPTSKEEFYKRYEGLAKVLLDNPRICGFCYTQLTDVEQEQNGIYRFDRSEKLDIDRIQRINTLPAKIEDL
jgi:beta-galactosidase/beta-glucuronidase